MEAGLSTKPQASSNTATAPTSPIPACGRALGVCETGLAFSPASIQTLPRDTQSQGKHPPCPREHRSSFVTGGISATPSAASSAPSSSSYLCCPAPRCPRGWGPGQLRCPGWGSPLQPPPPSACSSWPRWPSASAHACGPCSGLLPGSGGRDQHDHVSAVTKQTDRHGEGR